MILRSGSCVGRSRDIDDASMPITGEYAEEPKMCLVGLLYPFVWQIPWLS
jgi:hypothetical protein